MAFIPVPDCVLAVIKFTQGTMEWSNTLWFRKVDFTEADMVTLADHIDFRMATYKSFMASNCSYVSTTLYDMRSETAPIVIDSDNAGEGSDITDQIIPISQCVVLTLYSATRGRSGRGRIYCTGFSEASMQNQRWDSTIIANVEGWYAAIVTSATGDGFTPVVVSRYTNNAPRENGVNYPVISYEVRSSLPGSQRRRIDRP